jgi:hypothetical protein
MEWMFFSATAIKDGWHAILENNTIGSIGEVPTKTWGKHYFFANSHPSKMCRMAGARICNEV